MGVTLAQHLGLVMGLLSAWTATGSLIFLPYLAWLTRAGAWKPVVSTIGRDAQLQRVQAEALRGLAFYVPRERLPAPEEDEYYLTDLVGLEARGLDRAQAGDRAHRRAR